MGSKISITEDLMREHGLLNRCLLIYEQLMVKFNINIMREVAKIIRIFIEDYHEKLEENYIFPVYLNKGIEVNLVRELIKQHRIGRKITDKLLILNNSEQLINLMKKFIYMYRAHETREDTIIFSNFRNYVSERDYKLLSEKFDEIEDKMFGEEGYEKMLDVVMNIEKEMGIYNLNYYTPKI